MKVSFSREGFELETKTVLPFSSVLRAAFWSKLCQSQNSSASDSRALVDLLKRVHQACIYNVQGAVPPLGWCLLWPRAADMPGTHS